MIEYLHETIDGRRTVLARTAVQIGVETRAVTVALGPWPDRRADPGGPVGLDATPVVVTMGDADDVTLVASGARRAGRDPAMALLEPREDLGLELLAAAGRGAEVVVIGGGGSEELRLARVLGGRAIAALAFDDRSSIAALARDLDLDVQVVVPGHDDRMRDRAREVLAPFALERLHHLVEVDPTPAFDELDRDVGAASLSALAAGAGGVLAGRLAVGNRRWRAQLAE